jgi:type IV secretion system protein TrbL
MPQDTTILTVLLNIFRDAFTTGSARIAPEALWLLITFFQLEIVLLGLWYLFTRDMVVVALLTKVVTCVVFGWFISNWPSLTRTFLRSFMLIGLQAGDNAISETDLTDPGNLALYGMSVTAVVFQHLKNYTGMDALYNIVEILFTGVAAWLVVITYFVLGIWMFLVLLEFYAVTAFSIFLLPFGMFSKTAFLAEKTFAQVCVSAVQVLALSFVTSTTLPLLVRLQTGLNPDFHAVMILLLGAFAMCALAWRANKLALAIAYGAPQLTIHDVTRAMQTTITTIQTLGAGAVGLRDSLHAGAGYLTRRRP